MNLNELERTASIGDLDALRVIGDSGRHRILSELIAAPCTAAELADRLAIPRTRVYYHLELLERHRFITVAGYRETGGAGGAERVYRARAASFRVDRSLLGAAATSLNDARAGLLDAAADDVRGVPHDDDSLLVVRTFVRMNAQRRAAFRAELDDVLARYRTGDSDATEMEIVMGFFAVQKQ